MSEKYKFHNPDGIYFVTSTIVEWVPLFLKKKMCDIILNSLKFCQQEKGLVIHAWCIMPNHIHLIISRKGTYFLSDILRDFKRFTSIKIAKEIESSNSDKDQKALKVFSKRAEELKRIKKYKIWQDGNHPVELYTNKMLDDRLNYLHENPVKSSLMSIAEDYAYSSAKTYCGEKGQLEIELIE
ncbi:MAG: transposase [Bacteroidetes bacterium]|jgi:REP element-mobilizing transposase RayT|nr:transposase [Bacteroidota bacterium]MBT5528674.1 transposase [Cytophagia bacterium]MBT3422906.1 transposase [Bacteroidota bacterium]MBT3800278.1 transposase [Bacteroidota bacterium]MBT3934405.1 transposase [Bacteroidota bacterium]